MYWIIFCYCLILFNFIYVYCRIFWQCFYAQSRSMGGIYYLQVMYYSQLIFSLTLQWTKWQKSTKWQWFDSISLILCLWSYQDCWNIREKLCDFKYWFEFCNLHMRVDWISLCLSKWPIENSRVSHGEFWYFWHRCYRVYIVRNFCNSQKFNLLSHFSSWISQLKIRIAVMANADSLKLRPFK